MPYTTTKIVTLHILPQPNTRKTTLLSPLRGNWTLATSKSRNTPTRLPKPSQHLTGPRKYSTSNESNARSFLPLNHTKSKTIPQTQALELNKPNQSYRHNTRVTPKSLLEERKKAHSKRRRPSLSALRKAIWSTSAKSSQPATPPPQTFRQSKTSRTSPRRRRPSNFRQSRIPLKLKGLLAAIQRKSKISRPSPRRPRTTTANFRQSKTNPQTRLNRTVLTAFSYSAPPLTPRPKQKGPETPQTITDTPRPNLRQSKKGSC